MAFKPASAGFFGSLATGPSYLCSTTSPTPRRLLYSFLSVRARRDRDTKEARSQDPASLVELLFLLVTAEPASRTPEPACRPAPRYPGSRRTWSSRSPCRRLHSPALGPAWPPAGAPADPADLGSSAGCSPPGSAGC